INSTIANNTQQAGAGSISQGAGIANIPGSGLELQNVTIAGNSGSAQIDGIPATVYTIIAGGPNGNCAQPINSLGGNLDSTDECGFHALGDQTDKDPLLGPLANNGGSTDTEALLAGSPAIDPNLSNPMNCLATDQRGFLRPFGASCGVGAFEA